MLQINDVLGILNYVHFYPLMEMTSSYARDIIAPQSSKEKTMSMLNWWFILCISFMAYSFGYYIVWVNASLSLLSKSKLQSSCKIHAPNMPYSTCIDFQYTINCVFIMVNFTSAISSNIHSNEKRYEVFW